ncbi:PhzF family phenazine biosynthesis protein [Crassaminicella profunda]|uniref:PhzF family phenazine biosynthesis protein n=1 Tax=Crassaminicella profunda TaxID=1286698 RepID=UPI001CA5FE4D|nr:PhzF family phenazine biosynthesis protein [Crassaminicella profunda]QZY53870.1 PhzF family phenazine biosynthesis protein [Crassaminicella profunda]
MKVKVYTLNAFGKSSNGGNPAGVVLNADTLSDNHMQRIAKEVGFSETAFVQKSNDADFKIRFFTPSEEVDLCGHATIACFYVLANKGIISPGKYKQETKAGVLDLEVKMDGTILMNQALPEFLEIIDKKEIANSLNISEDEIASDLPIQIVSTGLKDILIPIKNLDTLLSMKPDFDKITEISKKYNVVGYHAFTLETKLDNTAHCRNFAPLYDIPEESATGTSNGALSCYLFKYGKVTVENKNHLIFEQGYSMNKPSEISASLSTNDENIIAVKVGGNASDLKEKIIEI